MSRSDEVERLFKDLDVFPKIKEVAKLANRVCATIHELESQLAEKDKELQAIKGKRKGASLNELMEWSVKELAELVIDLIDEENEKVIK